VSLIAESRRHNCLSLALSLCLWPSLHASEGSADSHSRSIAMFQGSLPARRFSPLRLDKAGCAEYSCVDLYADGHRPLRSSLKGRKRLFWFFSFLFLLIAMAPWLWGHPLFSSGVRNQKKQRLRDCNQNTSAKAISSPKAQMIDFRSLIHSFSWLEPVHFTNPAGQHEEKTRFSTTSTADRQMRAPCSKHIASSEAELRRG
jgi:hypothetical protein